MIVLNLQIEKLLRLISLQFVAVSLPFLKHQAEDQLLEYKVSHQRRSKRCLTRTQLSVKSTIFKRFLKNEIA